MGLIGSGVGRSQDLRRGQHRTVTQKRYTKHISITVDLRLPFTKEDMLVSWLVSNALHLAMKPLAV